MKKLIGKVTEEGLRWIERHVEKYIMCDIDEEVDYGILIYFTKIKERISNKITYL